MTGQRDGSICDGGRSWSVSAIGTGDLTGILAGMTMTTIKVPKATRDRLHRLAAADGVTLAQEIDKLVREQAPRPRPTTGGFQSSQPLTAEEIDDQLAAGLGDDRHHR